MFFMTHPERVFCAVIARSRLGRNTLCRRASNGGCAYPPAAKGVEPYLLERVGANCARRRLPILHTRRIGSGGRTSHAAMWLSRRACSRAFGVGSGVRLLIAYLGVGSGRRLRVLGLAAGSLCTASTAGCAIRSQIRSPTRRDLGRHRGSVIRLHRASSFHKQRLIQLFRELRRSTAALPDGVIILSSQREIVWFNRQAARLLGLKRPMDLGLRIDNLIPVPGVRALPARR